jgi:TIR domain-containing protein
VHPSKVFISYAREDFAAANRLFHDLSAMGVDPWLDQQRLLPGQHWENEIKAALQASDFVVLLLSKLQVKKQGYVQSEVQLALKVLEDVPDNRVFLLPLRLDDCQPAIVRLSQLHWLDLFPSWEASLEKLRLVLARVPEVAPDSPPAVELPMTYWDADQDPGGTWRIAFMPDGVFQYEDAAIDFYHDNATWKLSGKSLYIQLNDSYVQLTATLQDDGSFVGQGASLGGWEFKWKASRREAPHQWKRYG